MPKPRSIFLAVLLAGSAAITWGSVSYLTERGLHPFVLDKEPLPLRSLWLMALYTHVATAVWALPACVLLSSRRLLARAPRLHRWLGRVTAVVVLLGLCPSGFVLSSTAQGGMLGSLGFVSSGLIVAVAMVQAVRAARDRRVRTHARCAAHVLAQLSVAVTSRALLFAFARLPVDEELAYLIALWLPVVVSASYVERRALTEAASRRWRIHETHRIEPVLHRIVRAFGASRVPHRDGRGR